MALKYSLLVFVLTLSFVNSCSSWSKPNGHLGSQQTIANVQLSREEWNPTVKTLHIVQGVFFTGTPPPKKKKLI